jgi:dephospho-CoA kinase
VDVQDALRERWGDRVFGPGGEVDRAALGEIVFADGAELRWLEQLVHPRVVEAQRRWLDEVADERVAVVEVPLLYETGAERRFDAVVAITAPERVRRERTVVAGVPRRENRLLPDEEKMRRADYAYVNDGSLAELDAFVADVLAKLTP